jgi:outer membrane protein assembly factor BamD (BamD/ComL family)
MRIPARPRAHHCLKPAGIHESVPLQRGVVSVRRLLLFALLFALPAFAATERGIMVREGIIFIAPDASSAKISNIGRGREVAIVEHGKGWLNVVGTVDVVQGAEYDAESEDRNVTGWIVDKGVITAATPDGDKILFGEAVDSEREAEKRGGRRGAAQDAMRLYARLAEYFPQSPLAAEALYRAADIRWQIDAADQATRPSAKLQDPSLRVAIDESYMKQVIKKYPGTKWADLASYHFIANKLCGDWQAEAKCPEKEADIYLKFAADHPQSSKAPEALYNAAWRYAALITIYQTDVTAKKKVSDPAARATDVAKKLIAQYPNDTEWTTRAQRLIYMVQENIPTWGTSRE